MPRAPKKPKAPKAKVEQEPEGTQESAPSEEAGAKEAKEAPTKTRKRTRASKAKTVEEKAAKEAEEAPASQEASPPEAKEAAPEEKPKKKRGRKSKEAAPAPEPAEESAPVEEAAPAPEPAAEAAPEAKEAPAPRARKKGKAKGEPRTVADEVEEILADERVIYFPIKHFSPVCAFHVAKLIREVKPVGVLVEGPQDASSLIPYIVHKDTTPPFTIFSSYVDRENQFGLNGILSPSENLPARFRGWWPMTEYAPEYVALKVGHEVGAKLEFCDTPLTATIPHHHVPRREITQVVNDRHLAENAYFEALRLGQRRRSFDEFWNANFETNSLALDTWTFIRRVLTFAYCARNVIPNVEALEADGTLLREGHMRFVLDAFLKNHPTGKVVVVTGAFHSVALPKTKKQKVKLRADKNLETLLTPHSFRALATLYELNRLPNYSQVFWEELTRGAEEPFNNGAMRLLLEIMRKARESGEGLSTADSVEAYRVARNLATLRKNHSITLEDLLDAVRMSYIKGDVRLRGGEVERITREVLIGHRLGRVTSEAGQAPLVRDFYDGCRTHKLDTSGAKKVVRCDLGKQEGHRSKSAFLHQCSFLKIPMFSSLEDSRPRWSSDDDAPDYFKGPDIVSGENMHLIGETWGIQWKEIVDDRLLELSDRGASLAQAAISFLREALEGATGNAADTTRLLLKSAQMMLLDVFDELLLAVEDAIVLDSSFENLVKALHDFVVLYSYRDTVSTQGHRRLLDTVVTLFNKAVTLLPMIANAEGDSVKTTLDSLQTLVRVTLTFEAIELDRQLLVDKLFEMLSDLDGAPVIRGAGYGILFSLGATREKIVARELEGYLLGSTERLLQAGSFLDGLFMSSKNIFMSSPRLLRAINGILGELDWETFKMLLPHLRRAFTQFIPTEIDQISARVSEEIGLSASFSDDEPIPIALANLSASADARVRKTLEGWI